MLNNLMHHTFLSRHSRQKEWLSASMLSICFFVVCLSVCLSPKCQKTRFSQKRSNIELWSLGLLTTYRKSYMGFSKNPLLDPENPRWLRSAILKIDMTWFFSAEAGPIWIKFRRLVQNDMSTAVIWSKLKPDVEFQYGGHLGEFHLMSSQSPRATCHSAGCCHLANSVSWSQSYVSHCWV